MGQEMPMLVSAPSAKNLCELIVNSVKNFWGEAYNLVF